MKKLVCLVLLFCLAEAAPAGAHENTRQNSRTRQTSFFMNASSMFIGFFVFASLSRNGHVRSVRIAIMTAIFS